MILGLNGFLNQILGLLGPESEKHYRLKNYCGMSDNREKEIIQEVS